MPYIELPQNKRKKPQNNLKQTIILQTKTTQTREVGQDSTAGARAREASIQPAPQHKSMRAHQFLTKSECSQNQPTPKQRLVQLNIWVDPIVKSKLRDSAKNGNTSLSQAAYEFLKRGMQQDFDLAYGAMLRPAIENTITKHMKWRDTVSIQTLYYTAQIRSLVTNMLYLLFDEDQDALQQIVSESQEQAKDLITNIPIQIAGLIKEVEADRKKKKKTASSAGMVYLR